MGQVQYDPSVLGTGLEGLGPVVAVAGPSGAGKTTWIAAVLEQLAENADGPFRLQGDQAAIAYWTAGAIAVDRTLMQARWPTVTIWDDRHLAEHLLAKSEATPRTPGDGPTVVFLEFGFHLDPMASLPQLERLGGQRVVVLPPDGSLGPWDAWATAQVQGVEMPPEPQPPELLQLDLTGQVFDPLSLDTLWQELLGGAYGTVHRAKAVLNFADGEMFAFDYRRGSETVYRELPLEPCRVGRPDRPSALEVVGQGLNRPDLRLGLEQSALDDDLLMAHQHYLQTDLADGPRGG